MAHLTVKRPNGDVITYVIPKGFNKKRVADAVFRSKEAGEPQLWRLTVREKRWLMQILQAEEYIRVRKHEGVAETEAGVPAGSDGDRPADG